MNQLDIQIERLRSRGYAWPVPWAAVEMMARKENCKLKAYLCPAKVWTIGWGETDGVVQGQVWTAEQCDAQFFDQVCEYARAVQKQLTRPATPNELGAMMSLSYNIGLGSPNAKGKDRKGFYWSSVRRLHNAGDAQGAARAFGLYNKATVNGQLQALPGLTARRALEAAMYLTPEPGDDASAFEEPQAQSVAPESPMSKSPLNQTGLVLIASGIVKGAAESSEKVATVATHVSTVATSLNLSPGLLLSFLLLAGGAAVMYWRYRQRKEGWA